MMWAPESPYPLALGTHMNGSSIFRLTPFEGEGT